MKFTRILALVLVGVMLALSMASCGGASTTSVTFKVTIKETGEQIADVVVEVPGKEPTILDAIALASERCEFTYELNNSGTSVESIGDYAMIYDEETGYHYSWYFTLNGAEPESSASITVLSQDDVIEYIYDGYNPKA